MASRKQDKQQKNFKKYRGGSLFSVIGVFAHDRGLGQALFGRRCVEGLEKARRRHAEERVRARAEHQGAIQNRKATLDLSLVFGACSSSGTPAVSSSRLRRWVASMKGAASQRCAHGMAHPAASVAIK